MKWLYCIGNDKRTDLPVSVNGCPLPWAIRILRVGAPPRKKIIDSKWSLLSSFDDWPSALFQKKRELTPCTQQSLPRYPIHCCLKSTGFNSIMRPIVRIQVTCWIFCAGSLSDSVYMVAFLVWRCQLGIAPICSIDHYRSVSGIASSSSLLSAGRGSHQSRLLGRLSCKPVLFVLMTRQYGMVSLLSCASYLGRFPTQSIVVLKLFLTELESGASMHEY